MRPTALFLQGDARHLPLKDGTVQWAYIVVSWAHAGQIWEICQGHPLATSAALVGPWLALSRVCREEAECRRNRRCRTMHGKQYPLLAQEARDPGEVSFGDSRLQEVGGKRREKSDVWQARYLESELEGRANASTSSDLLKSGLESLYCSRSTTGQSVPTLRLYEGPRHSSHRPIFRSPASGYGYRQRHPALPELPSATTRQGTAVAEATVPLASGRG